MLPGNQERPSTSKFHSHGGTSAGAPLVTRQKNPRHSTGLHLKKQLPSPDSIDLSRASIDLQSGEKYQKTKPLPSPPTDDESKPLPSPGNASNGPSLFCLILLPDAQDPFAMMLSAVDARSAVKTSGTFSLLRNVKT